MKAERKCKEGALLFVKAGVYLCKVKLSSKLSLYTDLGLDFLMVILVSEHPGKTTNLFHKRRVIENISSGAITNGKFVTTSP